MAVMRFLVADVSSNSIQVRGRNCDCIVFVLPFEFPATQIVFVDPVSRLTFNKLHQSADGVIIPHRDQRMTMVAITVDRVDEDVFLQCIFPDVLPGFSPCLFGIKVWNAIFCAPHEVDVDIYE